MTSIPDAALGDLFDPRFAVRRSDPETSAIAALANPSGRANDRRRVLEAHYRNPRGLTDFQLARLIGRQQTSAGKRRGELRDAGLIEETTERRPSDTGSPSVVWRITARGIEAAREIIQQGSAS